MNSTDRLCVVAFPLYYYIHITQISYSLIIAQYMITIIAITSIAAASLIEPTRLRKKFGAQYLSSHSNNRHLSDFLKNQKRFTYTALISCCFTFCINCLNLLISFFMALLFLYHVSYHLTSYRVSYLFTVLVVVPSILEDIYIMDSSSKAQIVLVCCMYLHLLNSFNMALLFLYRQRDFRYTAIQCFKNLFYGSNHHIQPVTVIGIGG
ncbi:unnamed protein product [Onchocerca flexuosa]|uniref:GPI mannosyltransferase 2 n=1 Tax=Onchocerca flexuosa TaxID=387005 RepID=A0A183HIU8_9BILA|nr:unnamed protein product [Onchocerca flexuosa]